MGINFTIKDCPREIKAALEQAARRHRRSQNAEAIVWLEERAQSFRTRLRESELLRRIQATAWKTKMSPEEQDALRCSGRA